MTIHTASIPRFDAVVIGAGIAGIYQLHRLREQGFSALILEAGSGVGGAWYWNRYPGARLDSESYTYGYFFSEEIQNEWSWSEEFVSQPELERYFNFVVDRLDLRRNIRLDSKVVSAVFDEGATLWQVETADDYRACCRFLITALGLLTEPQYPNVPGLKDFKGERYHTARWPTRRVEVARKKVAVIGTGSSGVQIISAIGRDVAELTVFQRTPNWCTPLHNKPLTAARQREIREAYRDIHRACIESPNGFKHLPRAQSALEVTEEERRAYYEQLWADSGLRYYVKNFADLLTNQAANNTVTEFLAEKIRQRVKNPAVADKLIPKDHGFAVKRPPLETNYYEVFNLGHVRLVEMGAEPIRRFTEAGIETSEREYAFDVIVLATGFDAITGALDRIDIRGRGGLALKALWQDGPRTYLGMMSAGFPNLLMSNGPQGPTGNNPRTTEFQVDLITDLLVHMRRNGLATVEASGEAVRRWVEDVNEAVEATILRDAQSWAFGSNVPGKKRAFLQYAAGLRDYREKCSAIVAGGYWGLVFGRGSADTSQAANQRAG